MNHKAVRHKAVRGRLLFGRTNHLENTHYMAVLNQQKNTKTLIDETSCNILFEDPIRQEFRRQYETRLSFHHT